MTDRAAPDLDYSNLPAYLTSAARATEIAMARHLPAGEPAADLYDLARDYPQRGGKRFRPALLLLSTALAGGDPARALPSAVALEIFQNFALVHDDIEDNSLVRRGKPALHRLHGVPLALNAGDLLFGLVYEALLENEACLGSAATVAIQRRFSQVFRKTFEGQAMDIGWVVHNHLPTREEFEVMIQHKTGWYSGRGPCEIGAVIGGAAEGLVELLGDFGERLGIGFQVRDDLLNLTSDSAAEAPGIISGGYGKERGGDIAEGKRTLIIIEMMERLAPGDRSRLREILITDAGATQAADIDWVIEQAHACGALRSVQSHCRNLGLEARELLDSLPGSPQRSLMIALTEYLIEERTA